MVLEVIPGSHVTATVDDAGAMASRRLSANIPSSARHSMDEYYQRDPVGIPAEVSEEPPAYDALLDNPSLRRRFNIQPREDEGHEVLPAYSSGISLEGVFMKKMELEGAVNRARDRNWYRVLVTLQGTALSLHNCKVPGVFGRGGGKGYTPDYPPGTVKGSFLRSYSLQHADVGIAADYVKKRYVIRVRAEADQFLLSCQKIETFVLWLQSLFVAIDLAPPLDDREIPRDLSIPRRSRRRIRPAATNPNAGVVPEQQNAIQEQAPSIDEDLISVSSHSVSTVQVETIAQADVEAEIEIEDPDLDLEPEPELEAEVEVDSEPSSPASSAIISPTFPTSTPDTPRHIGFMARARQALQSTTSIAQFAPAVPNPSISPDGKWRPQHQWTPFYDMMYAKRCMAILTHRSPRKSNLVILMGKQWIVDWATGKLTRCHPPDYSEVVGRLHLGGERPLVRA